MGARGFYNIDTFIERLEADPRLDLFSLCRFRFEEKYLLRCAGLAGSELIAVSDGKHGVYVGATPSERLLLLLRRRRETCSAVLKDVSLLDWRE